MRHSKRSNRMSAFAKSLSGKIKRPVMWLALGITGFVCVALNLYVNNLYFARFDFVETRVTGVVKDVQIKNNKTYLTIKDAEFTDDTGELANAAKECGLLVDPGCVCILKDDESYKNVYIGSYVCLRGKVRLYDKATNPGQFDMRKYYISNGCLYNAHSCELIETDSKKNLLPNTAYKVREYCCEILDKSLKEKDAGIMKALLLADKTDLDSEVKDLYKDAGAGHLLAISGLHISMFAAGILWVLKRTPIKLWCAYAISVLCLITYGYVIGFSPSSFRAIIMFMILCVGKVSQKTYDTLTAMAVSALITVMIKPLCTLQTGFLMSYTAIIGIAAVTPMFKTFGRMNPPIIESVTGSLSVSLTTLPVMVNTYYKIPLYAVVLNMILIPGMSFLLGAGVLCIAFGAVTNSGILNPFSYLIHFILALYEMIMKFDMMLPFSNIITGARNIPRCLLYEAVFLICAASIYRAKLYAYRLRKKLNNKVRMNPVYSDAPEIRRIQKRKIITISLISILMSINLVAFLYHKNSNKIEFLDVGQGLCACVQYNGQVYCYDGGSTDKKQIYKYVIGPYLDYYGIKKVDAWFISHDDADHTNGITEMFDTGDRKVSELIIPVVLSDKEKMKEIEEKALESNCRVIKSQTGDCFKSMVNSDKQKRGKELNTGNVEFYVLSPSPSDEIDTEDSNACSLVVLMRLKEGNVLFAGDCDDTAQVRIVEYLNQTDLLSNQRYIASDQSNMLSSQRYIDSDQSNLLSNESIDIYQVAHHGSAINTNGLPFLESINPKISVISCGFNNSYGHPHTETLDNLSAIGTQIYRTDQQGCITILLK